MPTAPTHIVHALWIRGSGLHLWIEQVAGHKIVLPSAVPPDTLPPAVEMLLDDSRFRHRLRTVLRTPRGKPVELVIPTAAFAPPQAVEVLASLSFLDEPSLAVPEAKRQTIGADLLWLIRFFRGLHRFIRAGRVTIRLCYEDYQWWPQWQLTSGLPERGWIGAMAAAVPGILPANNSDLIEDLTTVLPAWMTPALLAPLAERQRTQPWQAFSRALLSNEPLDTGSARLLRDLNAWRDSMTSTVLQLVVVVEEPQDDDAGATGATGATDAAGGAEDAGGERGAEMETLWPIRVRMREGEGTPQPIVLSQLDHGARQKLEQAYERAGRGTRLGDPSLRWDPQHGPAPGPAEAQGDWDIFLTTDEMQEFLANDVRFLKGVNVAVLLPRSWTTRETTTRLYTGPEKNLRSWLGLYQVVDYDWRVSIDDVELTEEEMQRLVASKSGLVKLRGNWVMADTSVLTRVNQYMEQLGQASRERLKERQAALEMKLEFARAQGDDRQVKELSDALDALRREAQSELSLSGAVPLDALRAAALADAARHREPVEYTGSSWVNALLGGSDWHGAPERVRVPETVHATLRDYQQRGVDWLYWMSQQNIGAVLADDMGLGKTLQLLVLLAVEQSESPTLVVAPTSVVTNWAREAATFTPSLRVHVHHGPHRLGGEDFLRVAEKSNLIVTSYGVLSRDWELLGEQYWDHVVLDEAQMIKNPATKASRAARSLPARHRIALTGTPIENRLSELRSILDFVNPGVLGSAAFFRAHFAVPIERDQDAELTAQLQRLTAPFILRRLKTDPTIIDDLPEKSEEILTVSLTTEQTALYKALVDDVSRRLAGSTGIARRGIVLGVLTRIKQICNHPAHYLGDGSAITLKGKHRSGKVAKLMELLGQALEEGRRVLIFTQYRAFGELLQPYLSEFLGEAVPFLHGGVVKQKRDAMVASFQAADGPRVMLLSLKAGGTGLNLTAASMVIHLDRWWNPAVENQATDRAYRIGQGRDVKVYKMITAGTLEEAIHDVLEGKRELAGAVVGQGEAWITELEPAQLAELMTYREK